MGAGGLAMDLPGIGGDGFIGSRFLEQRTAAQQKQKQCGGNAGLEPAYGGRV